MTREPEPCSGCRGLGYTRFHNYLTGVDTDVVCNRCNGVVVHGCGAWWPAGAAIVFPCPACGES